MVIGNGTVANSFSDFFNNENILIFASGVANSKEISVEAFERETQLLNQSILANPNKIFVYFSTCSIYDPQENSSPYVLHKLAMEQMIMRDCERFNIFRVSNIVGYTKNRSVVFNFLVDKIKNGITFDLWINAYRNIIDIEDVKQVVKFFVTESEYRNKVINIANPHSYSVEYITEEIQKFIGVSAKYNRIHKGDYFEIEVKESKEAFDKMHINFSDDYIYRLLVKYYNNSAIC